MRKQTVALIVILVAVLAFNIYMYSLKDSFVITYPTATTTTTTYPPTKIIYDCTQDSDCVWGSINCCGENAGASWSCVNKQSYVDCQSRQVLCPQVISQKPTGACSCVSNRCSG